MQPSAMLNLRPGRSAEIRLAWFAMKVLIVEDQERLGSFLEQGLKECAYTATWVRTCAGARDALAGSAYDVILLDLGLPDGDGIDLLRQWRSSGFNEPVLILSARDAV